MINHVKKILYASKGKNTELKLEGKKMRNNSA